MAEITSDLRLAELARSLSLGTMVVDDGLVFVASSVIEAHARTSCWPIETPTRLMGARYLSYQLMQEVAGVIPGSDLATYENQVDLLSYHLRLSDEIVLALADSELHKNLTPSEKHRVGQHREATVLEAQSLLDKYEISSADDILKMFANKDSSVDRDDIAYEKHIPVRESVQTRLAYWVFHNEVSDQLRRAVIEKLWDTGRLLTRYHLLRSLIGKLNNLQSCRRFEAQAVAIVESGSSEHLEELLSESWISGASDIQVSSSVLNAIIELAFRTQTLTNLHQMTYLLAKAGAECRDNLLKVMASSEEVCSNSSLLIMAKVPDPDMQILKTVVESVPFDEYMADFLTSYLVHRSQDLGEVTKYLESMNLDGFVVVTGMAQPDLVDKYLQEESLQDAPEKFREGFRFFAEQAKFLADTRGFIPSRLTRATASTETIDVDQLPTFRRNRRRGNAV